MHLRARRHHPVPQAERQAGGLDRGVARHERAPAEERRPAAGPDPRLVERLDAVRRTDRRRGLHHGVGEAVVLGGRGGEDVARLVEPGVDLLLATPGADRVDALGRRLGDRASALVAEAPAECRQPDPQRLAEATVASARPVPADVGLDHRDPGSRLRRQHVPGRPQTRVTAADHHHVGLVVADQRWALLDRSGLLEPPAGGGVLGGRFARGAHAACCATRPAQRSRRSTCSSDRPVPGSVSTSRVGASRSSAQRWHVSSRLSSIQAAGRSPAYSSIASTFQCAEPKTARPWKVRRGELEAGELEQGRQVLVRLLLPAGGPHDLVALEQPPHPGAAAVADAVRDAVDEMEAAGRPILGREVEQADHSVHVEEQNRTLVPAFSSVVQGIGLGGRTMGNVVLIKRSRVGGRPVGRATSRRIEEALTARNRSPQ